MASVSMASVSVASVSMASVSVASSCLVLVAFFETRHCVNRIRSHVSTLSSCRLFERRRHSRCLSPSLKHFIMTSLSGVCHKTVMSASSNHTTSPYLTSPYPSSLGLVAHDMATVGSLQLTLYLATCLDPFLEFHPSFLCSFFTIFARLSLGDPFFSALRRPCYSHQTVTVFIRSQDMLQPSDSYRLHPFPGHVTAIRQLPSSSVPRTCQPSPMLLFLLLCLWLLIWYKLEFLRLTPCMIIYY